MIKIGMKKTCDRCKALDQRQYVNKCLLGYSFNESFKPLEPCPKPKTINEFYECHKQYKK